MPAINLDQAHIVIYWIKQHIRPERPDLDRVFGPESKIPLLLRLVVAAFLSVFQVVPNNTRAIDVINFLTEESFDSLIINGLAYSGSNGPQGVVPQEALQWISDAGHFLDLLPRFLCVSLLEKEWWCCVFSALSN